ncbi:MAG: hypothetical protein M0Z85_05895 [Gammaproteobacteria bacterium]|nr:hypothetical protein [Gammaproteobacteria bacterium]
MEQSIQIQVEQAARMFLARQARDERCRFCAGNRGAFCSHPYAAGTHCRTADHVAARMAVTPADVRRRARQIVKGQ